jgi:tRNA modification GTPase
MTSLASPRSSSPDTIFALASGGGRAAVSLVRVSGPGAGSVLEALAGRTLPSPRAAVLRALRDPESGELLDRALCLWFPGPASFTGEDVVELHLHGGRAVLQGIVSALSALGCRPAEPGEFSRRAFDHGKLDLTEAEAIADLVDAETAMQRRQALRQMDGALGRLYEDWRARLLRLLAHLEADLDFPDEDLPEGLTSALAPDLEALTREMSRHLQDGAAGQRLREGLSIALLGAPNAGKSSLLNALAGRDVAIVSARAGTTRDVIDVHLDLGGYPVTVADTAGLREAADEIESEGVRRALDRARHADLKLLVLDGAAWPAVDPATAALADATSLVILSKGDLGVRGPSVLFGRPCQIVSADTGAGLAELLGLLQREISARYALPETPVLTRTRHRLALQECLEALDRALRAPLPELAAEDVRLAARALGRITGRVDVEDVLDVIFRDFCIGK